MDIKAMAKSKRSHTRHNQPRKPNHPSKIPSTSSSSSSSTTTPNPTDSKKKERKGVSSKPPSLPSNWDRYDEDPDEEEGEVSIDSDSDDPGRLTESKKKKKGAAPDVVKPKSKGADFRELIAQAKESKTSYTSSFDDTLNELYQGLGPMLVARGESIQYLDGADDFLAEDETSTPEVPFLSLNLEAIAEQLSKVNVAERLFIEADLLPPELCGPESSKTDTQAPFQKASKAKKAAVPETFEDLYSLYLAAEQEAADEEASERQNDVDKEDDESSSVVISGSNQEPHSTVDATANKSVNVTENKLDDLDFLDVRESSSVTPDTKQDTRPSTFEAASAEAELDMPLGSFSETKLSDSVTHVPTTQNPVGSSKPVFPTISSLDDALDDLLEETSKPNNKDSIIQSLEIEAAACDFPPSSSLPSDPSSKSKVLDDFDSWLDTL